MQATFGPTRAGVASMAASMQVKGHAAAVLTWIREQMALNATLHRTYYRQRVNARTVAPSATGGVHSACTVGSRWHRFALLKNDVKKDLVISATGGGGGGLGYTFTVDGVVRTEVAMGSSALPAATRSKLH